MSEDGERKTKTIAEMVGNYPAKDLPVIFADQAPVTGRQGGVVKFYPAFAGWRAIFQRFWSDSSIMISALCWIDRGGHGEPGG